MRTRSKNRRTRKKLAKKCYLFFWQIHQMKSNNIFIALLFLLFLLGNRFLLGQNKAITAAGTSEIFVVEKQFVDQQNASKKYGIGGAFPVIAYLENEKTMDLVEIEAGSVEAQLNAALDYLVEE